MLYSCVPNGFYFSLRLRSGGKSAQTYEECWYLSIFSRLDTFLQFFGQVNDWQFDGMIGMSHVVAWLLIFILRWQGRVCKEWRILCISCRGQFNAWITPNFADIVNFVSLILCLIVFCVWSWATSRRVF